MKRLFWLPLLLLSFGCAQNHFNVPAETFAEKVRVLGVVPIVVDADSIVSHPQKDQLITVVTEMNRKYEQQFVRKIKGSGNFYTVALLDGDPGQIFSSLLFRREKRDDAAIQYNKYFWKNEGLREYLRKNNLDAAMIIVVSGLRKTDKIFSSNLMRSMTSDYDYLIMTAQILDSSGTILWEYPNFRSQILAYDTMINLQYPDFSEAEANLSTTAIVKFKTIEGIKRSLDLKRKDLMFRETQESDVYGKQFDEMLSLLKYDPDKQKNVTIQTMEKPSIGAEQPKPVVLPAKTPEVNPSSAAPPPAVAPATPPPAIVAPATPGQPAPAVEVPLVPVPVQPVTPVPEAQATTPPAEEIVPAK